MNRSIKTLVVSGLATKSAKADLIASRSDRAVNIPLRFGRF